MCDKCAMQYWAEHSHDSPQEFMDIVKAIASLHKKGVIGEKAYQDSIRYILSVYIQSEIERKITHKLDKALCEKFSPKNLLEALV